MKSMKKEQYDEKTEIWDEEDNSLYDFGCLVIIIGNQRDEEENYWI